MVALIAISSTLFGLLAIAVGWPVLGWATLLLAPVLTSVVVLACAWTLFRLARPGRRTVGSVNLRVRHARSGS